MEEKKEVEFDRDRVYGPADVFNIMPGARVFAAMTREKLKELVIENDFSKTFVLERLFMDSEGWSFMMTNGGHFPYMYKVD